MQRACQGVPAGVLAMGLLGGLLPSCASGDGVRAVVSAEPPPVHYELARLDAERTAEDSAGRAFPAVRDMVELVSPAAFKIGSGSDFASDILGDGVAQLDATVGPLDLGYPLLIDLGAGDAPYDDGVEPLDAVQLGRSGFSDSVMRFTWRERLTANASWTGGAAFLRAQDSSVLEGLADARFGFAVLGLELRL